MYLHEVKLNFPIKVSNILKFWVLYRGIFAFPGPVLFRWCSWGLLGLLTRFAGRRVLWLPRGPLCLYPPHLHWLLCQSFVFRFSWSSFLMLLSLQPSSSASPPLTHCCAKSFHSPTEIIEFKVFRSLPWPCMDKMKHRMQTAFTGSCERAGHSQYIFHHGTVIHCIAKSICICLSAFTYIWPWVTLPS